MSNIISRFKSFILFKSVSFFAIDHSEAKIYARFAPVYGNDIEKPSISTDKAIPLVVK